MKKTLLLSVVASTMIMAGGDIAPVEPVVETPAVAETTSAWTFGGQAVGFTQTADTFGTGSLFASESTYAAWGAQLSAVNSDIFAGIGAGVEVSAIVGDTGTGAGFYGNGGNAGITSGGFTQAYLTYGLGDTNVKVGRQLLPKGLSPFAYSEGWQMFKNTFDAAVVSNTSLPSTTLVYAFVKNANRSVGAYANEDAFTALNGSDGVHMVTAQNKSITGVTLTGTYYTAKDAVDILWGDAKTKFGPISAAVQGGQVTPNVGDTATAYGVKLGASLAGVNTSVAYSSVSADGIGFANSTGIKSALYTQMLLNNVGNFHTASDSDFLKVSANTKLFGGKFIVSYGNGTNDTTNVDYSEIDVMYKTKITQNTTVFAAYGYTDISSQADASNFVRFWARYSFN